MSNRRKKGDGTVYQMADGRWGAAAYYDDENGDRRRKNFTAKTEELVRSKMENWINASETVEDEPCVRNVNESTTLEAFVEEFKVNNLSNGKITSRTYQNYVYALNRFVKFYPDKTIGEIDRLFYIRKFFDNMVNQKDQTGQYKYSQDAIRVTEIVLKKMFDRAAKKKFISLNPFKDDDYEKAKSKKETKPVEGFQDKELKALLAAMEKSPLLYPVISLMANTGMRTQEVLALKWGEFDMSTGAVHINHAITKVIDIDERGNQVGKSRTVLSSTKTVKSKRVVYVDDDVIKIILQWKNYAVAETKTLFGEDDFMFGNSNNPSWTYGGFRSSVNRFLKKNGGEIDHLRLHSLRHTVGTMLGISGASTIEIMRLLGHSKADTTLRYVDEAQAININNRDRIGGMLRKIRE